MRGSLRDDSFVEDGDAVFRQRAHRELAMGGMPDLAHDQHVERQTQRARHLGRHDHSPARQAQDQIRPDLLFFQGATELLSGVFT